MFKIILFTAFALVAFAFNSMLCRMALSGGEADAAGFTLVRLVSGAVTLSAIGYVANRNFQFIKRGNLLSAFFLFAYAICFSFAYLGLTAGTGALILFGSVQMTMLGAAVYSGDRPRSFEWLGLAVALVGLIYLVFPGLASPPLLYSALMATAGVAWGFYTLLGRTGTDPIAETAGNFAWSVPMVVLVCLPFLFEIRLSSRGWILAILSGAVASGIGYSVWYAVLRSHTATRAAVLQLSVPVIAAVGGVLLLAETATARLWIAGLLILSGIGLTIFGRRS
ncbi:MAG: DMT family transporter [Pyrinomonadaceae bacterium]